MIKTAIQKLSNLESFIFISGSIYKKNIPSTLIPKITCVAINEMVKTLALEIVPVRINVVSPGVTNTPLYDVFENKTEMLSEMANNVPLKRVATSEEIAEAIMLVLSNKNMTGAIIDCDGGATL